MDSVMELAQRVSGMDTLLAVMRDVGVEVALIAAGEPNDDDPGNPWKLRVRQGAWISGFATPGAALAAALSMLGALG